MPVVGKITVCTAKFQYDSEQYEHITENIFPNDETLSDFLNNDIEAIWERCIDFIKWYNQNKK